MRDIITLELLLCAAFLCVMQTASGKTCKALHVGTDTANIGTINDIVSDGVTNKMWSKDSFSPVIVTHSKKLEYFYLADVDIDLSIRNIKLSYDNEQYANSTVHLKKEPNRKHWYTIEIVYNCEAYGGALLTYNIQVDVPGCGTTSFVWKKVCGYPLTPRDGFTIDMSYSDTVLNIVKNGVPVNDNFWDVEIEDWAIKIPAHINTLTMDIYMNPQDATKSSPTTADPNANNMGLESILRLVPEATVSTPRVDSDDAVSLVTLQGVLSDNEGGIISNDKTQLVLKFECQPVQGSSTVEFGLPLVNFRDINLFFYKDCDHAPSLSSSFLFWILIALVAAAVYKMYTNITGGGRFNVSLLIDKTKDLLSKLKTSSSSSKGYSKAASRNTSHASDDDEADGEFNIKNMSEIDKEPDDNQYGTI